jgi:hypothetical protein
MKNKISFIALLLISVVYSCDKIDDPLPSNVGVTLNQAGTEFIIDTVFQVGNLNELNSFINDNNWASDTAPDNSKRRFILLEEFTGHKCTFCPNGTREIVRLDGIYKEQLIPIGIHAGNFAIPVNKTGSYSTDFRVDGNHGEVYNSSYGINSWPSGVVSRIGESSGFNQWEIEIQAIKDDVPAAGIKMINYFATVNNIPVIRTNIEINWLETKTDSINLQVFLVEDHIIDWQLDLGVDKPNYDHRHVLRKVINDTYGKVLSNTVIGEKQTIQYIFEIDKSWKPQDLEVVAFIFDREESRSEAFQVNAAHVQ